MRLPLIRRFTFALVLLLGTSAALPAAESVPPLYAMDTAFKRPGLTLDQQLDLVAGLGYSGVAWHEQSAESLKPVLAALDRRGLKMTAIYCQTKFTPEGRLIVTPVFADMLAALEGRDTIVWLHFGGKGPAVDGLTADTPAIADLRRIADQVARHKLRLAIYPHFWEWTARFADAVKVAEAVDRDHFGVGFNLCHSLAAGSEGQIPALLKRGRKHLMIVTICGADQGVRGGKWNRLIQPLGEGDYDVGIVLRTLRELDYTGPIGFQGYGIKQPPRDILTRTMNAWRQYHEASSK